MMPGTPSRLALALALGLSAAPAGAALPPCAIDELIRRADAVVQITVVRVVAPVVAEGAQGPYWCGVTGDVARSFRGGLATGARIDVHVPCGRATPMPGPTEVTPEEKLRKAPVLELHLRRDGGLAAHGAGVAVLDAPTDAMVWEPNCK